MSYLRCLLSAVWLLIGLSCQAETVRLCFDAEENLGKTALGSKGITALALRQLGQLTGTSLELTGRGWKRCLAELQANVWDGIASASYTADRQEFAAYPMKDGKPDETRRLRTDGYSLFRRRGSPVNWDGRQFSGIYGMVGAQPSYSILDQLRAAGLTVDSSGRSAVDNLRKLLAKRLDAVALSSNDGDQAIQTHPELQSSIERIDPPLVSKSYYLVFSKAFYASKPALVHKLWDAMPAVRESSEYQHAVASTHQP